MESGQLSKGNQSKGFPHRVEARVSSKTFQQLSELLTSSENHSMSSLIREILENKKLLIRYRDHSFDDCMEELVLIHQEINRIGVNINQVTKEFNRSKNAMHQILMGKKLSQELKSVKNQMKMLETNLAKIQSKWLSEL